VNVYFVRFNLTKEKSKVTLSQVYILLFYSFNLFKVSIFFCFKKIQSFLFYQSCRVTIKVRRNL